MHMTQSIAATQSYSGLEGAIFPIAAVVIPTYIDIEYSDVVVSVTS